MPAYDFIKADIPALQNAISKFRTCKDQLATAYGQMATEAMSLDATWNGEANAAFMDRFAELTANIRTSDATIDQAVTGLQTAVDEYTEAENLASSMLDGMTEATSPFGG